MIDGGSPAGKDITGMTVQRLSACSVKVQLSQEELRVFLPEAPQAPDSPQMLRMLSFLLSRAEAVSGIAFSALPVTVELITAEDGSLAAYFTVQQKQKSRKNGKSREIRLAAQFPDSALLIACCNQLQHEQESIKSSLLYRCCAQWILTLRLRHARAAAIRHILLEYGRPYRLSSLNRARLTEYGECIYRQNAVAQIVQQAKPL